MIGWFNLAKVEFLRRDLVKTYDHSWPRPLLETEARQHFAIRMEFPNTTSFEDEAAYCDNDRATPLFAMSW